VISCVPVLGLGEVRAGDDLATALLSAAEVSDGDIVVVTSKVVSKAEGRVVQGDRTDFLDAETDRVVARRGPTSIVRTRHGLVMAAAGIDASNTAPGTVVLLPVDPDASARALRESIASRGLDVGVVVTDTAGRAWRDGQTDIAIGAAGVVVLDDHQGRTDRYGNELAVTAPAVADEIAGMAELATGKLSHSPAAVVSGLERFVLPRGEHGPGAAALVRPESGDMFGLGSREAVVQALLRSDERGFGGPGGPAELAAMLHRVVPEVDVERRGQVLVVRLHQALPEERRADAVRAETLAFAYGWRREPDADARTGPETVLRFVPATP
jgi:coenzyme F420-0:L-glutamate ligase / coenzyme F420-1:gamma-L-glutamate ligase